MAKTPLQRLGVPSSQTRSWFSSGLLPGASCLLVVATLAAWVPAASARPVIRVHSGGYSTPRQPLNFPAITPGVPLYSPVQPYGSVQTTIQPGLGVGLSVQIGRPIAPTYYPAGVYPSGTYSPGYTHPSGYIHGQPVVPQQRGSVNNSVLINPTVINSPIRNSTLVNPTIVTTPYAPYYPAPYYNIQTVTTTTRPEPEVYIDSQYGVRYRSPSTTSERQIIVYPQTYP